jgi:nicotine blue oxidoreductase
MSLRNVDTSSLPKDFIWGAGTSSMQIEGGHASGDRGRCIWDALGEVPGATVLENKDWSTGMGSSLQVGLAHLNSEGGIDEVVVSLVDLPGLTSEAVARIVSAPGEIVVAAYDAKRGHPVKFASSTWPELIKSATGDQGARSYIAEHPDQIVLVEVGDVATGEDMDIRPTT